MKGGGGQQPNTSNDTLWIAAFFVLAVSACWYIYSDQIVTFLFHLRVREGEIMLPVVMLVHQWLSDLGINIFSVQPLIQSITEMSAANPETVGYKELLQVSSEFGFYFVPLVILVSGVLGSVLFFGNMGSRYKSIYDMKSFRQAEQDVFPVIKPVINKNLVKVPLDKGAWSSSKTPMMLAKELNLLERTTKEHKPAVRLKKGKAFVALGMQMGDLWKGLEPLPPYVQALFAIFAAKGEGDSAGAYKLLYQIAKSSEGNRLDYTGTRELLVKHVRAKGIGRAVGPHAYVLTVMASMLEFARTDGVLASAEFLWLKPLDRSLWYMLNSVGRQVAFAEVAGPFGHWLVEKRLRRPLKVPMVAEAVSALDAAIEDVLYNPDDDE